MASSNGGEGPSGTNTGPATPIATNNTTTAPLYGTGAPEDRDWDTVEDVTDTIGDQGEGLPAIGSFVLYKLEPLLKEKEDFDNWFNAVSRILEGHGLQRLIDKNILRPTRNSPNAETWMKLSMQVSSWLRICIDPDVAKYITSSGKRTKWADDFMHECKLHMRGEGHGALSAAMVKFMGTKKAEFSTTTEFIEALQQRFKTANDLKAGLPPYAAIVIMVTQLQEITKLRSAIEIKNNELKSIKDPSAELTIQDFFLYCSEMKDKIKEFGIDGGFGANATATKTPKQGQQQSQSSTEKKDKLTNAPPPGKSAWKHVNEWKKHKTQRTATGNCSYCGGQGHDAKDCYYLVADDRPSNWKPKPGLWYWKTKEHFHEDKSQQLTGKPTERTKQANFDAVASSATSKDDKVYDFAGMAVALDDPIDDPIVNAVDTANKIQTEDVYAPDNIETVYIPDNIQTILEDDTESSGFAGSATTSSTRQLRAGIDWILDSGSSWHICTNRELFITYDEYKPGTAPGWDSSTGHGAEAIGHGDIILPIRKPDGSRHELKLHCQYRPGNKFSLLGYLAAHITHGMIWNPEDMLIKTKEGTIGYTFVAKNVPFIELANEPFPVQYHDDDKETGVAYTTISAELAHRRLGHAGSYKGRINKDKLGCDVGSEHYDCEACGKGKSKKIISRDRQARSTKVGQLLHIDLHPVKPKGLDKITGKYDREHTMIITDDYSRFRVALHLAKKSDASRVLQEWTEQFKEHTGYYPTEWRFDNGTEFHQFTKWAKSKLMLVSPSAAYAHEQNGVSEFSGHYIMQVARTIHLDAEIAPKELWTEAVSASTYIINRLSRSGGEAPILAWRKAMNLRGDESTVNLSFLRVWYSKAYVHKPKETRIQSMKMDPRAWIGYLVGYEGDNGHCYRIYNPTTKKVSIHRDVVFFEPRAPQSYDGANDLKIGEEETVIDGPPPGKTQFSISEPVFKTTRQAMKDLSVAPITPGKIIGEITDQGHVSSGEEHQDHLDASLFSEGSSVNTEEAELFYNTQEDTLENRVQALRLKEPETPIRQVQQQASPPRTGQVHQQQAYRQERIDYPRLPEIYKEPATPSPTPSPLTGTQQNQINLARQVVENEIRPSPNPARLDPPERFQPTNATPTTTAVRRSPRSTKGQSPERYQDLKWKKYGEPDRSGGSQCAVVGSVASGGDRDGDMGLMPNDY
ncbi:hypothetical protein N7471_013461 [Penicillium samsonianum]|uniref:uncharacterized protein n=1 Tax=Penicillium samsonianum TaxID=1882272 RepID=UPI002547F271|nr:uncharacterized protein N7471_013461 [Penicillium samsonianum]KAJ6118841.1 hypothetical protein N7471_013461 [Penicillium samsonianum]